MVLGNHNLMNVIKQLMQTCGDAARTCWLKFQRNTKGDVLRSVHAALPHAMKVCI